MSVEEHKAVVRMMFDAINKQDLALMDEVMAPDFVMHMHGREKQGWDANRQFLEDEIRAFPDLHVTIEAIIAEGDIVCVRLKETATHKGDYRGLAPTGRNVSYLVAAFWRLAKGSIAEGWVTYDQLDFLKQLGAIQWNGFPDEVG